MHPLSSILLSDAQSIISKVDLSSLARKKVLITGASGIVGTYFTASLGALEQKQNIDCELTALAQAQPGEFFSEVSPLHTKWILGDLSNPETLRVLPRSEYDLIIHAAGYGQPGMFMSNPVRTLQINTTATFDLFNLLKPSGSFLFLSTSEVYSGLTRSPHLESDIGTTNTTHPRSCYIEAKRCGEAICNAYRAQGVSAKSARLALAYGPGTRVGDKRVLNSFVERAIREKRIKMMDRGIAKRTYCYVTDAVELMWHILLKGKEPVYNVGGHSKTTIADLANEIGKQLDIPVEMPNDTQEQALTGAPDDVSLDMTRAESEFKKKEYISLPEGIRRTIDWQKILYRGV